MKKKLYFLFAFFILTASLFVWWKPLSLSVTRVAFKYLSQNSLGEPIDFDELKLEKGQVILVSPRLGNQESTLKYGGLYLEASKAVISYDFSWAHKALKLHVSLNQPHIQLVKTPSAYQSLKKLFTFKPGPIQTKAFLRIDEGELALIDAYEVQKVGFNFEMKEISPSQEIAHINLFDNSSYVKGFIHRIQEDYDCKLDLAELKLSSLTKLSNYFLDFFGQETLPPVETGGLVHGSIDLLLTPGTLPLIQSRLEAHRIEIKKTSQDFIAKIPKLSFTFETLNRVTLQENLTFEDKIESLIQNSAGSLKVPISSNISYFSEEKEIWKADQLRGKVLFSHRGPSKVSFEGAFNADQKKMSFSLEGQGFFSHPRGDVQVILDSELEKKASLRLSVAPQSQDLYKLTAKIDNFKPLEVDCIKRLFSPFYSKLHSIDLKEGSLDAQMQLFIDQGHLTHWITDEFELNEISLGPTLLVQSAENLSAKGHFSLNLGLPNPYSSATGEVEFEARQFEVMDCHIENVEGHSTIRGGELQSSKIEATFENIQTHFEWSLNNESPPLSLHLQGIGEDFFPFLPQKISRCYREILTGELIDVQVQGNIQKNEAKLNLNCTLCGQDQVNLGCSVTKISDPPKVDLMGETIIQSFITPLKVAPTLTALLRPKSRKFKIQEGWFNSEQTPLETYVSPLIFEDSALQCSGRADLKGSFNSDTIAIEYSNYDIKLDHTDLSVSLKSVETNRGHHYFNLVNGAHFGELCISEGSCFLKGSQLNFTDLKGDFYLTSSHIHSPHLTSLVHGINLAGNLNVDFIGGGEFVLKITQPNLEGDFSNFQQFFSAFGKSILDTLPLEGKLRISPSYGSFELWKKEGYSYEMDIKGELQDGKTLFGNKLDLFDLSSHFTYHSKASIFELEQLHGKWPVTSQESFDVESHYFQLGFNEPHLAPFDLRIKNSYQDKARLQGFLTLDTQEDCPEIKITLDSPENHLGHIEINRANLRLKQGLEYLHLDYTSDLNFFAQDVNLLHQMFDLTSFSTLPFLKEKHLEGKVSGQWLFNKGEKRHQFYAWGDHVKLGQGVSSPLQLKGHAQKGFIYLDSLQYLNYKGSFKIEEKPMSYMIHDFRLQDEDSFYLDLSGTYCKIFNSYKAHVHKCSCDFAALKEEGLLPLNMQGKLDLKGSLEGGVFQEGWICELNLKGQSSGFEVAQFQFKEAPIEGSLKFSSKGLNISHLKGELAKAYQHSLPLSFVANQLNLNERYDLDLIQKINYELPVSALEDLKEIIKEQFDAEVPQEVLQAKKEGRLKGSFSYFPNTAPYALTVHFESGEYHFFKTALNLVDPSIQVGPKGILFGARFNYLGRPYWFNFKRDFCMKDLFSCTLYDRNPERNSVETLQKITLKGRLQDQGPVLYESVHGSLGGVKVDFVHRPKNDDKRAFMGQIQLRGTEYIHRLPRKYSSALGKFGVGEGYFLSGELSLDPANLSDFEFSGLLGGRDFDCLGYEFKSLSSSITIQPGEVLINELKVSDLSGEAHIPKIAVIKKDENYHLNLPKLTLKNFKPSLLHAKGEGIVRHKPLIIESLELNDLSGNLSDTKSFKGSGSLTFLKSPKKHSSLLHIPGHILSKLGLDLTMLNPVEGKILYDIHDEKIELTRFLDVYSHDRRCHFQLSKSPIGSYIDFDGHVHVKIKMKQFVLLKLTEPFIISIHGNVFHPKYSFKRKKLEVDLPETLPF